MKFQNIKHLLKRIMGAVIIGIGALFVLIGSVNKKDNSLIQTNVDSKVFDELGTDLIAEYETKYNEYNLNRSENIKLAVKKVDEAIVMPNEIFSFNDTVGPRSEENGFKLATVYHNGKVTDGFGGGVCQVSSTLYNATLFANLQIIERKGHLYLPAYIHAGGDATVADGYVDFKFKNTRKYPIKIKCSANNGILCVKLYGKKEKDEYSVEIKSKNMDVLGYKIIYETDENMKIGEKQVIQERKKWI